MAQSWLEELNSKKNETGCNKGFRCLADSDRLCKARKLIVSDFLECMEDNPEDCKFAYKYGTIYFCKCPVREHLAKKPQTIDLKYIKRKI